MTAARLAGPPDSGFAESSTQVCNDELRVSTCFFMNEIPSFAGAELERLYGSIYASIGQFLVYDHDGPASTYVARRDSSVVAILLFRLEGHCVKVLNEVIQLDIEEINRFARFAFASFPAAQVIMFHALGTGPEKPDFLYQRYNCLEDIVLALPGTEQAYFASLGKNTRRNLKRYQRKLLDVHPGFCFDILDAGQIDSQIIDDIVALNRARMAVKKKVSALQASHTDALIQLAQHCGLVGVARINGRVCAGAISFRTGKNYYLSVIAHDPLYDEFWLGILCCYMTICACIARGGKEFHFLWGEYEYKYTLLGVRRDLDNLTLYRSPLQLLRHADVALKMLRLGLARRLHLSLHAMSHSERPLSRWLRKAVQRWRNVKDVLPPEAP